MKLKNRKTGEIVDLNKGCIRDYINYISLKPAAVSEKEYIYNSLAELYEEWEDAPEEPSKTIWQIKNSGKLQDFEEDDFSDGYIENSKSIGNYFETREEVERAVEKLKAWKRLKDGGFKIRQWRHTPDMNLSTGSFINIKGFIPEVMKNIKDLDLLFGGEE